MIELHDMARKLVWKVKVSRINTDSDWIDLVWMYGAVVETAVERGWVRPRVEVRGRTFHFFPSSASPPALRDAHATKF